MKLRADAKAPIAWRLVLNACYFTVYLPARFVYRRLFVPKAKVSGSSWVGRMATGWGQFGARD